MEVRTAPLSLQQLKAAHANVIRAIQAIGVPAESDIDVKANRIKVYVTGHKQLELAMSSADRQLLNNVQIVEISRLSQPQADWFAGNPLPGCTTGFSLWNIANRAKYSSTAAHCPSEAIKPLSWVFSMQWGKYDFQVDRVPVGDTIRNWAADNIFDSTPYYREITGWWTNTVVGAILCKYGLTTGFTCGIIESNNYNFQNSASWLLIHSLDPNMKISCGGDSGSPVYSGSTAVGELVAGWCALDNNKFIAMPVVNYLNGGYPVLTHP